MNGPAPARPDLRYAVSLRDLEATRVPATACVEVVGEPRTGPLPVAVPLLDSGLGDGGGGSGGGE